ncbi:MBL fold metallo-hydrolase [Treponema parvum]|uniref:MBL fold metallo-hydrolase n=1 Tax=Treponema parvum TaxID=138851 RepID=A0A975EZN0_9SPIR|nr:MBL fold metallo-hydrolase [Treponema parvum]QTQ11885.1 MBL fold metallo-hydrolase [Treponema parvum]QTQ16137.1 MBL fold metallo-hydrolase [Treponema parvum]
MLIYFWGVRGSIPTCLTSQQIQKKISAVVQRITPNDIVSEDSRERFIASLPDWLYGTTGGDTPCVQLVSGKGKNFILDAGSGLRVMSKNSPIPEDKHYNMFFSHFHWDHIQGLPFFDPIYNPEVSFDIYSIFPAAERILAFQMQSPYFPVKWESCSKKIKFHRIRAGVPFTIDGVSIVCCKMSHPGNSYSYAFVENGKKFVYATDVELTGKSFEYSDDLKAVFSDADVLVFDAQYTLEEALLKENWGHSAFCTAIDFAVGWNVKQLYLFHHEPIYDDQKLDSILQSARWYVNYIVRGNLQVFLAVEGLVVEL